MHLCTDVKRLCTSLRGLRMFKRGKETKCSKLEISQPFNFKREITTLPGLSEDEISVLREQAAASCVGIAEAKAEQDNNRHMQQHQVRQNSPHHTRSRSANGIRSRSTSASPQRVHHGQGQQPYARPPTSHSTNSLLDYHSSTQRYPLSATAAANASANTGTYPPLRSYTPGAGSTQSNRSGNGNSRCASPMSMSNRSLKRLVLPSLTSSSANGSGANSDCDSPGVGTPGAGHTTTGIGKVGGMHILDKLGITMPVSPVSSLGLSDLDGEDRFFIGSPVSPLSPRGSPKSGKVRL